MQVITNRGTFRCRRVVVAGGAWINSVLSSVGVRLPLTVTQEQVLYLATPNIKEFTKSRCVLITILTRDHRLVCPVRLRGETQF